MQIDMFTIETVEVASRTGSVAGEEQLFLLFGNPDASPAGPLVTAMVDRLPNTTALGCSTAGEIVGASARPHPFRPLSSARDSNDVAP